ncbi:Protein O-mannosyltransferase 2 [Coemansia aciculifera]|nr:Protein O-mannosyltransferase 2 [Coemansia aciculifera]
MSLFEQFAAGNGAKGSMTEADSNLKPASSPPPKYSEKASLFASDSDDDDTMARPAKTSRPDIALQQRREWRLSQYWVHIVVLTIFSAMTRFYKIGFSNRVIFDEAHHMGFGGKYVNHTFYHDVHPPLAKMLIGLSEALTGFDGSFDFKSGSRFPANVNYTFMRLFNASFGATLAPMAYATLVSLGCSPNAAFLAGLLVCFDNALCTISRFALLDAMLMCFTAMSVLSLSGLYKYRKQPFSAAWFKWLLATGVSLGLVASAKWVGFLAVALVGLYTLYELYDLFGQKEVGIVSHFWHWATRVVALVAIPVAIYMLCFVVHFGLLYKSGPGDAEMDSLFQAGLQGSGLQNQPLDVAYGSKITLKSAHPGAGLLHSHTDAYPDGSKQQQITGYSHKDTNNDWIVKKVHGQSYGNTTDTIEFVKNGDLVRLVHERTSRNLHSHAVAGHVSKRDWEISGYGMDGTYPDINDHWRIEVVEELSKNNPERRLRTLATRFRLRHVGQNCVLRASGKSLPQWAWRQAEMVCDRRNHLDEKTLWNVENHVNPLLPPAKPSQLKSSFLRNFARLNLAMARSNNALTPDKDKFDALASSPQDWPIMRLGMRMCGWEDGEVKFWLIGNPVVWLLSTLAVVLGPIQMLYYIVRRQRGLCDFAQEKEWETHLYVSGILWGGWALHYLPFFAMGRVTYQHHYFPALYFAAMYLAYFVEWTGRRIAGSANAPSTKAVMIGLGIAAIANFLYFAPFTFGFDYPAKDLAGRKWFSSWNIYDTTK